MSETLPILDDRLKLGPWIRWGGSHITELPDAMNAVREWAAVPVIPIRPKWEVTKSTGDNLVGIIEDAPPFAQGLEAEAFTVESLEAAELSFGNVGLLVEFIRLLPEIRKFIEWVQSQGS